MFDAKPEDRESIALYVQEIFKDHKKGPDGNLIEVHKVTFGKKGTANYQRTDEIPRLQKHEPQIYAWFEPLYEGWKKNNQIPRVGLPLESWPAITAGQTKACKDMGIFTVEDIATATSSIRDKLGLGASELMSQAKAFVANKDKSASANLIASQQSAIDQLMKELKDSRETVELLMAKEGKKPIKPKEKADA